MREVEGSEVMMNVFEMIICDWIKKVGFFSCFV